MIGHADPRLIDAYRGEHSTRQEGFAAMSSRRDAILIAFAESLSNALSDLPQAELRRVDAIFEEALPSLARRLQAAAPERWVVGVAGSFVHGGAGRYIARF